MTLIHEPDLAVSSEGVPAYQSELSRLSTVIILQTHIHIYVAYIHTHTYTYRQTESEMRPNYAASRVVTSYNYELSCTLYVKGDNVSH